MDKKQSIHDIKSALSSLQSATELLQDEWENNPELIDQVLPLMTEKISEIKILFEKFRKI